MSSSPSPSTIAQEWLACFGPGGASDFFDPEDPRSILGITPRQVRDRLDAQTREVETLRREMTEMRKQMKEERKQLQQQVNSFAAAARATARQETSLKEDALSLVKMRHQRELARLAEQHEQEVAALKAENESLKQQQQPQQQEEVSFSAAPAAQQTQQQQAATSWSTRPPPEVPYATTFASATTPFPAAPYNTATRTATFRRTTPAGEEEMKTTASPIATTRATTRSTIRGGQHTHTHTQTPEIAPNHGMPIRSDQELAYLKERLMEVQELYNVMQAAFQEGSGAEEEETKWGVEASSAGGGMVLDPSLGGIDVYPTEPTGVGEEEGGRRRGGSTAATTTMRRTGGMRIRAFSTTTTTAPSKGAISDAPYTRLDPTMYTAMSKANTPMTSRRPSSTYAMHMNESQDIREIFGRAPSPLQEQKEQEEEEEEEEEEIEDVHEEEGGNEVVYEDEGSWLKDEGEEEETEETKSEEEESSEEESSEEEDSGESSEDEF